jgi:hypothetical protein
VVIHAEESFWWYPLRGRHDGGETSAFLTRTMERYDPTASGSRR